MQHMTDERCLASVQWQEKEVNIEVKEANYTPCFVTKNKDSEQVNIAINLKAIPEENEKEAYALSVVNNIFGGSTSSRLFRKLQYHRRKQSSLLCSEWEEVYSLSL